MIETELFPIRDGRVARDGVSDYKITVSTGDIRDAVRADSGPRASHLLSYPFPCGAQTAARRLWEQGTQGVVTLQMFGKGGDGKDIHSKELKLENRRARSPSGASLPPLPLTRCPCAAARRSPPRPCVLRLNPFAVCSLSRGCSRENFTRNRTDVFYLRLPDLGELQKCRVSLSVRPSPPALLRRSAFRPSVLRASAHLRRTVTPPSATALYHHQPVAGLMMDSWFLSFIEVVNETRKDKTSPVYFNHDAWRARFLVLPLPSRGAHVSACACQG